ncbi:MAG: MOSC domain-containing protein [Chloroflexi bacterium]|nr:MOSC domain-containing protein [Chloroflexota bacterium]
MLRPTYCQFSEQGALMSALVIGLYTAPRAGAPVEARAWVEVVPGVGIIGDRYALGLGHWSDPKWPDQELTLVEAEVAEALDLDAGQLRRNIVTRGIRLNDLIGTTFQIGGATLAGVRPCDPCRYLESLTRPGILKALAFRGGLRARILRAGRIRVGDAVLVVPSATPVA